MSSFSLVTAAVAESLQAIGAETGLKPFRWTGQEAFAPPACWIASAALGPEDGSDQCSTRITWTFELWFAVAPADTANRELTRLEDVVTAATTELVRRTKQPDPFAGRTADLAGGRVTDPSKEGVAAFVAQLRVGLRIQPT